MQHPKDEYILSLIGDEKTKERGLSLLIDKYKERIYWHIRRLVVSHEDAQDVMQETFFNACRYIDRFESESRLYTWLYRIATNECIRVFRKNKLIFTSYDSVKEELINKLYYETSDESDKIVLKFQEAILHLPKKQRLVFNLRYYDEMSTSSSKTNYHYASEKVKNYMLKL